MKKEGLPESGCSFGSFGQKMALRKRGTPFEKKLTPHQMFQNTVRKSRQHFNLFLQTYWQLINQPKPDNWPPFIEWPGWPTKQQMIETYEDVISKLVVKKRLKVNWSKQQLNILLWMALLFARVKQRLSILTLEEFDWQQLSESLPGRNGEDCYFKLLSFQKHNIRVYHWSQVENQLLSKYVQNPEKTNWVQAGKQIYKHNPNPNKVLRSGKQCRQHFYCHLDPNLKKGPWTKQEDKLLLKLFAEHGRRWFDMTKYLLGRNENAIKNRFVVICKNENLDIEAQNLLIQIQETHKNIMEIDNQESKGNEEKEVNEEQIKQQILKKQKTQKKHKNEQKQSFASLKVQQCKKNNKAKQTGQVSIAQLIDQRKIQQICLLTEFSSFNLSINSKTNLIQMSECSLAYFKDSCKLIHGTSINLIENYLDPLQYQIICSNTKIPDIA